MSGVAAQGLVGRTVRVYWEEDIAWYLGSVVSFDVETHKHKVFTRPCYVWHPAFDPAYIPSGFSQASSGQLAESSIRPAVVGVACSVIAHHARTVLHIFQCAMKISWTAGAQVDYADGAAEEVLLAAEKVRLHMAPAEALPQPAADELAALAAALQSSAGAASTEPAAAKLRARAAAVVAQAEAAASQEAAQQEAASAAAAGPPGAAAEQPAVLAAPDPAAEATPMAAAEVVPAPPPPAEQQQQQAAEAGAAHGQDHPTGALKGSGSGKRKRESTSGSGGGNRGRQSKAAAGGAAAESPRPGELVWAQVKGWPFWPALVFSHEDADDLHVPGGFCSINAVTIAELSYAELTAMPADMLSSTDEASKSSVVDMLASKYPAWKQMPDLQANACRVPAAVRGESLAVCFFGTQEYMRLRPKAVVPWQAGLKQRLHAKCRKAVAKFPHRAVRGPHLPAGAWK